MPNNFTCERCPLREQCVEPCAAVESMLPRVERGRMYQFHRANARRRALRFEDKRRATRVMLDYRDQLEGRQREIFDLTYNEGMSQEEIADKLDLTRDTVKNYLARAREALYRLAMGRSADRRREPR